MTRFFKDPLVHFLVIGAALFALASWRGDSVESGRERIEINAEQVAQVRDAAALLEGRPPTAAELAELIEPAIREEVLYREALALGLDVDDDEVRRRLIEKMQYVTRDLADPEPASEDELRGFYDRALERFEIPELVTFDQAFFSPGSRGDEVERDAEAALAALRAGAPIAGVGDRTPLRETYDRAPREQVDVLFGAAIAEALFTTTSGEWLGPLRSDFGVHVLRLRARSERRLPPFEEIRDQVREAFAADRRRELNEAEYRRMRDRYEIVVDWPAEPSR
jgi:hypothetical protein